MKKISIFLRDQLPGIYLLLIKKRWIMPEPIDFVNRIYVSDLFDGKTYRMIDEEVKELFREWIIKTAFEIYIKYRYWPVPSSIFFRKYPTRPGIEKILYSFGFTAYYTPFISKIRWDELNFSMIKI